MRTTTLEQYLDLRADAGMIVGRQNRRRGASLVSTALGQSQVLDSALMTALTGCRS
jgi:hypothetical protein